MAHYMGDAQKAFDAFMVTFQSQNFKEKVDQTSGIAKKEDIEKELSPSYSST